MPVSIRFKGVVGTTAQIESDRFAGRIGWSTTLARYIVYFDATNYATMARRDVLETFAAGIQDSTLTNTHVLVGGTSGRIQGSSFLTYLSSGRLVVGSGIGSAPKFVMNATGGSSRMVRMETVGVVRWEMGAVGATETGSDAGSPWRVDAYTDAGVYIDSPFLALRASAGLITIGGTTARTTNFTGAIQTSGVTRISSGGAGTLTTLSTTGLATLASASVTGDLTVGGRTYVGSSSGAAGQPRIGSGVLGGQLIIVAGQDVTDASLCYIQMNSATLQFGNPVTAQFNTPSFTALSATATIGDGSAASAVSLNGRTVQRTIYSTTDVLSGNIFNQYTAVTQSGIVTNQSLASTGAGSRTIGAGRLNALGAGMEIYLCGTYTTDAAPGNATIRVRIGSTTFRTIGSFALDGSITNGIWWIRGRITTRTTGATGTVGGQLMWEHQASSVAGSQVLHIEPSTSTADVTVDLTASQTIDVDWTATDAGTSITCTCFSIDLIR